MHTRVEETNASILHNFCEEGCHFLFVKCENHIFYNTLTPLSLWVHAERSPSWILTPYIVTSNCSNFMKEADTSAYSQFVEIFVLSFNYVVMNEIHFSSFPK